MTQQQYAPPATKASRRFKPATTGIIVGALALAGGILAIMAGLGLMVTEPGGDGVTWATTGGVLLMTGIGNLGVAGYRLASRVDFLYRRAGGQ